MPTNFDGYYDPCCEKCLPGCNCRCGPGCLTLGGIFFVGATAFWLAGTCWTLFSAPTVWNDIKWYHEINLFFFGLAGFLLLIGFIYQCVCCPTPAAKVEAREPGVAAGESDQSAPTPYVMMA